jgi:dimethylhistidine N-methyltransferase
MFDAAVVDDDITGEALAGLSSAPKTLPPKLFYDAEGVRLFEAITQLPEYYLTRTEQALLARIAGEIAALAAPGSVLVEYGACDEGKARLLIDQAPPKLAASPFEAYVPVDIARGALQAVEERLARSHPVLTVAPVCGDFLKPVTIPAGCRGMPCFGFFPGSTIGNLEPEAAVAFLRGARQTLGAASWLIVGADIRKSPNLLLPAYDDAQGVTAAFNLNMLRRLNREAGGQFVLSRFAHRAIWNDAESRIEMHLESLCEQHVMVAGTRIAFAAGETIHTENSYKHTLPAFTDMARAAGWQTKRVWTDPAGLFAVYALRSMPA